MTQLNYIGVFLTFACRMGCSYCINHHGEFTPRKEISYLEWMKILRCIRTREDLPISLQGGEPTQYEGFYELVYQLHRAGKKIDLLTNGDFDVDKFIFLTTPEMFRRDAPYASIRFSYHYNSVGRELIPKVERLQDKGYSVGIWGMDHPDMFDRNKNMAAMCRRYGIDWRMKEYLDETHGTYKYPEYMKGGIESCLCKSSEMLFAPDGQIHRCHRDLYAGIDPQDKFIGGFRLCVAPRCNSCDVKEKTNRLQQGGHCSVEIKPTFHKDCKEY